MEFHISRLARDRYQFDDSLFSLRGNVIFANFHAVRTFVQKINQKRDLVNFPEQALKAGQINAMGLIDEILHYVVAQFRSQKNNAAMQQALDYIAAQVGLEALDQTLFRFTTDFPPFSVHTGQQSTETYLSGVTEDGSNRAAALEELLLLWLANKNPAFAPFGELFDDTYLQKETAYSQVIEFLTKFFEKQPRFGPDHQYLVDMLRSPAIAVPHSLPGQLEYIRTRWGFLLGRYYYQLLSSLDLIKEEEKLHMTGEGIIPIPIYNLAEAEPERFTEDKDWMPRVVMLAKNVYVWLDQLSRKYRQPITRIDQIPDQELDTLARRGFTALWFIGIWERSHASARIKQMCGNPEAVASAYSLFSYEIASDLGGEDAYNNLRQRAWQRGIRLASDMVPNHMGIDSPWVTEHPDWFISLDYSPFPAYSFNGPDLSSDGRASIFLEDHYYNRTDAAVVFKRVDNHTGNTQYIYHGNDGTSMPWNDTAQLNYLKPEVREAVIQTILSVARKFPIIRFDAAMTLAKRHYQRLWFPEPGSGGDIPSRAEHGMTRQQLDALMPAEFWREVVDRATIEAPDTLLLAEAFWLMEGYFVRTLGMHRVYNSAFMNMLRNEENSKYRSVMKNTLEFDPEILKRYVNFMNNPDERTAVDQFGKGDKYFGICMLMSTLPGLPMFGHGQLEGYTEKYGMEYRRAYWDEQPDEYLIERHEREICPILHRRYMFSGVDNFLLYDFYTPEGWVNEDVFAYSNGTEHERALVIYHNKYASTQGWVRTSTSSLNKYSPDGQRMLIQRTLGHGLNLQPDVFPFVLFRDQVSGLEFIRRNRDLSDNGLFVILDAYQYHVFLDFRQVQDDAMHTYRQLCDYLNGRGVPDIEEARRELFLQPVQQPFRQIANPGYFTYLMNNRIHAGQNAPAALPDNLLDEAEQKMAHLLQGVQSLQGSATETEAATILEETRIKLNALLSFSLLEENLNPGSGIENKFGKSRSKLAIEYLQSGLDNDRCRWLIAFGWLFVHNLGKMSTSVEYEHHSQSWFDEWHLGKTLADVYQSMEISETTAWRMVDTIRMLTVQQNWYDKQGRLPLHILLGNWLSNGAIQRFLKINRHKDILWFEKEAYEEFLWWMLMLALFQARANPKLSASSVLENIIGAYSVINSLIIAEKNSGYQVNKLLDTVTNFKELK